MFASAKRYRKFFLFTTWAMLLNVLSWHLPALLLSGFFSASIVGYFVLGQRVIRLPLNLIGKAVSQVFYQRAALAKRSGNLTPLVEAVFKRLVQFGLFPILTVTIVGPELFLVVFGDPWREAGVYTQILGCWMVFWFISSPLSTLFSILEEQEFDLRLNVAIFSTRLTSLVIGGYLGSARVAVLLFALSGSAIYAYLARAVLVRSNVPLKRASWVLLINLARSVPAAAVLLVLKAVGSPPITVVSVAGVALASYATYLISTDDGLRASFQTVLARGTSGSGHSPSTPADRGATRGAET
jgi:O-antigen/teichoic acid export membrane protein